MNISSNSNQLVAEVDESNDTRRKADSRESLHDEKFDVMLGFLNSPLGVDEVRQSGNLSSVDGYRLLFPRLGGFSLGSITDQQSLSGARLRERVTVKTRPWRDGEQKNEGS